MCHKNKLSLCLKAEKSRRQKYFFENFKNDVGIIDFGLKLLEFWSQKKEEKKLEEISLQNNVSLPLMSKLKFEVFVRDRFQNSKANALFSNVLTKI